VPWKNITVKSLCPLGKSLNIHGYSNFSKKDFINATSGDQQEHVFNRGRRLDPQDEELHVSSNKYSFFGRVRRGQGQNWMRVLHRVIGGPGKRYKVLLPENMVYLIRFSFRRMCIKRDVTAC